MKLSVKRTDTSYPENSISGLSLAMNGLEKQGLHHAPWPAFPYKPAVEFAMAYSAEYLFLKYFVDEKNIRAVTTAINGAVWEDSCVEFFISFDDSGYYNIECNCIGTALAGFGKEKTGRTLLPPEIVEKIGVHTSMMKTGEGYYWELTLSIPSEIFLYHQPLQLPGKTCRANFYKCGDLLQEPHFVAWTNIESAEPNFHLPEFFGTLFFA